jgi:hypothetical protein
MRGSWRGPPFAGALTTSSSECWPFLIAVCNAFTIITFLPFLIGIVLCYFGVSTIVEGGARWDTLIDLHLP